MTPRVDAIANRHAGPMDPNEAVAQYNDLLDLARQLERELAAKTIQPTVIHNHYHYQQPALAGGPAWAPPWPGPQITYGAGGGTAG